MKNKVKIFLGLSATMFGVWYFAIHNSGPVRKSSNFRSYQKEMKLEMTPSHAANEASIVSVGKKDQIKSNATMSKRLIANKTMRENPVINYLDQKDGAWSWSPDVLVVAEEKYKGSKDNIVGNHDGYIVVRDGSKPQYALNLIYNTTEKRLGIYMKKIVVLHEKSSDFENKLRDISKSNVEFISGVYFIEADNLSNALKILSDLQNSFHSAKVELDVNYATQRAN